MLDPSIIFLRIILYLTNPIFQESPFASLHPTAPQKAKTHTQIDGDYNLASVYTLWNFPSFFLLRMMTHKYVFHLHEVMREIRK